MGWELSDMSLEECGTMQIDTGIKLLKYRRTKIVATLGPSSSDSGIIERLITAGVNVFRLNMSHGTHETHRKTYALIRYEFIETGCTYCRSLS